MTSPDSSQNSDPPPQPSRPGRRLRDAGERLVIGSWRHVWAFSVQVLRSFLGNKGLLLAGAVAYNALLSLIPLLLVTLVLLSHFVDEERLLGIIEQELELIVPANAGDLMGSIASFLANRDVVGVVGLLVLLFLGSIAFRVVEDSLAIIFKAPSPRHRRRFWVSALIPYAFMLAIGLALLLITAVTATMHSLAGDASVSVFGTEITFAQANRVLLYVASWGAMAALFASIYKTLPQRRVSLLRAMIGGLTAALLWEVARRIVTWYFINVSLVNVVYGSLATVIVILLTMEVGAIILLLGAEVIEELETNEASGLPWYGRIHKPSASKPTND